MALTDQQQEQIDSLHQVGCGARRISKQLGISYARVRYYLEKMGVSGQWATAPRIKGTYLPRSDGATPAPLVSLVWDIETTDLRSDLGLLLCVGFLDLNTGSLVIKSVADFGHNERELVEWVKEVVTGADILIGHNSLGFDKNFINGVLARHGLPPLPPRLHYDTYQIARNGFKGLPSSYSLRNLADFFGLPDQKDNMSKTIWRTAPVDPEALERLKYHCEVDIHVTAQLWQVLKPYMMLWRGR